MLNEKRELIQAIEERHSITIKLIPDPEIDATSHLIDRENLTEQAFKATLNTRTPPKENKSANKDKTYQKPLVTAVTPKTAPPKPKNNKSKGLIGKMISSLKSIFVKDEIKPKHKSTNGRRRYGRTYNSRHSRYRSFNKKRNNSNKHSHK